MNETGTASVSQTPLAEDYKWIERISNQLAHENIANTTLSTAVSSKKWGGFNRLDDVYKGELETILCNISDEMWAAA